MNFFPERTAQNLPDWLEIATRGLVPSAQARVRAEIEAHYNEAVANHLKNGLPEAAAQTVALADLGDRYTAARRFNREHLMKDEAQGVAMSMSLARSVIWWMFCCLPFSIFFLGNLLFPNVHDLSPWDWVVFLLSFLVLIAVRIVVYVLAGRKTTLASMRRILLLEAIGYLIFGVGASVSLRDGFLNTYWLLIFATLMFRNLRLHEKLRSAGEDWSDLTPRDSTAA